ncbi:unnamed protein product, partial [Chrysoparadoxa australica]
IPFPFPLTQENDSWLDPHECGDDDEWLCKNARYFESLRPNGQWGD